jgi:hypothetical protein
VPRKVLKSACALAVIYAFVASVIGVAGTKSGWFGQFDVDASTNLLVVDSSLSGRMGTLEGHFDGEDDQDISDMFEQQKIAKGGKACLAFCVLAMVCLLCGSVASVFAVVQTSYAVDIANIVLNGLGMIFLYTAWITFTGTWVNQFGLDPHPSWAWVNVLLGSVTSTFAVTVSLGYFVADKAKQRQD